MKYQVIKILSIGCVIGIVLAHYLADALSLYWVMLPMILFALSIAGGAYFIRFNFFVSSINRLKVNSNQVAITFDDGPTLNTLKVLDVLDDYNAKGTFFLIGKRITENKEIAEEIITRGHSIGNHSYSHSSSFPIYSSKKIAKEIVDTNNLLETVTGKKNVLFRPPFGVTNPSVSKGIKRSGVKSIGWSIRSFDTVGHNAERVVNRIIKKIKPGSIILLHDDREKTPEILEGILQYISENNLKTVSLDNKSIQL
ncbi:polysaccharide deacetylase family protein [Mangrovivirga sp. M17]|uniref:Polysaccharide deacetylase family protein n=1 Tax=Mangrovivirga halotolerans TaxID=2993936 RepID=A0ABT3RUB3_9BACT|nr:polysaccharide deacetylase family protein [Mangrovivirga halotolerans]MCX2745370.1 polysaccharide deacetylase family protein [Mangrovivirga halotolerans]